MKGFFYVYVLRSVHDPDQHYVGFTEELGSRLRHHNSGHVPHTAKHRPWEIGRPDCPVLALAGNNGQVTTQNDTELLNEYVAKGGDSAFAHLVERHIGLVYSAALRIVVDPHLAEDVTQTTFAALARAARHLIDHPAVSAWLHRTASNQAAKLVRGEMRRRSREQEVYTMQQPANELDAQWKQIAPLLDGAINQLPERYRVVIFLRFFGTKSAREISAALRA